MGVAGCESVARVLRCEVERIRKRTGRENRKWVWRFVLRVQVWAERALQLEREWEGEIS